MLFRLPMAWHVEEGRWFHMNGAFLTPDPPAPPEGGRIARELEAIRAGGILRGSENDGARDVLRAAAWTYVAAAVSSLLTLLYFLLRSGLLGGRRNWPGSSRVAAGAAEDRSSRGLRRGNRDFTRTSL